MLRVQRRKGIPGALYQITQTVVMQVKVKTCVQVLSIRILLITDYDLWGVIFETEDTVAFFFYVCQR